MAQNDVEELKPETIASIAFASVLFGGSIWVALPKMLNVLEESKLEDTLLLLRSLLAVRFNESIAQWICTSWKYIEEETLSLLRYLREQHLDDPLITNIATVSSMV